MICSRGGVKRRGSSRCVLGDVTQLQKAGIMRKFLNAAIVAVFAMGSLAAGIKQPVKVDGGLVSGVPGRDPSVLTFKGIPFAAPPVGDLRWREPKPVAGWQGVRKADKFSAGCIQRVVSERKPWTYEFMTHGDISEDLPVPECVDGRASAAEKRPVFVYILRRRFLGGIGASADL